MSRIGRDKDIAEMRAIERFASGRKITGVVQRFAQSVDAGRARRQLLTIGTALLACGGTSGCAAVAFVPQALLAEGTLGAVQRVADNLGPGAEFTAETASGSIAGAEINYSKHLTDIGLSCDTEMDLDKGGFVFTCMPSEDIIQGNADLAEKLDAMTREQVAEVDINGNVMHERITFSGFERVWDFDKGELTVSYDMGNSAPMTYKFENLPDMAIPKIEKMRGKLEGKQYQAKQQARRSQFGND